MPGLNQVRDNKRTISGFTPDNPSRVAFQEDRGMIEDVTYICENNGAAPTSAQMVTLFPYAVLNINGDDYSKYMTEDLLMLELYNGFEFDAGHLTLPFSNYSLTNKFEQQSTAFIPSAHPEPELYLFIGDTAVNPKYRQSVNSEGLGDSGRQLTAANPLGAANMVIKHYRKTVDILTSGAEDPTTEEYVGGGRRIKAIHVKGDNLTRIRILVNEQEAFDFRSLTDLNRRLKQRGYVPQANVWHIDFVALADTINAAFDPFFGGERQRIDIEYYTSNTNDVKILAETYDLPDVRAAQAAG